MKKKAKKQNTIISLKRNQRSTGLKSATELSGEDKKKFFDEVDAEWKGAKEEPEVDEKKVCNEAAKQIVDKKQLEWFIGLANKAKDLDSFIDDLNLMKSLAK